MKIFLTALEITNGRNNRQKKKSKESKEVTMEETGGSGSNEDLKTMTLEELNTLLNDVLESEDYIRAIAIRDEINNRKKK